MAYGDGQIKEMLTKEGKSYNPKKWRITISFGINPVTKKQERVTKVIRGTKADARKVRDQLRKEHDAGVTAEGFKQTFRDFSERDWFEKEKNGGRWYSVTAETIHRQLQVINDHMGQLPLQQVTPKAIEDTLLQIRKSKNISGSTLRKYYLIINQVMAKAERYDYIMRNPCTRVDAPKVEDSNRRSLPLADAAKLKIALMQSKDDALARYMEKELRYAETGHEKKASTRTQSNGMTDVIYPAAALFALATGMRMGEVLALTWEDARLLDGVISVRHSIDCKGNIKAPKTKSGARDICIDAETTMMLLDLKELTREFAISINAISADEDLPASSPVFANNKLQHTHGSNFSHWWRLWCDTNGFDGLRFHELRHTHATLLLTNNTDIKTVSSRLGHASVSTTTDFYIHDEPGKDREAANSFAALLTGKN